MTAPGQLNRRVVLEAASESDDGQGGVTRLYDVVTVLWAKVTPLSARSESEAHRLGAALRATITIRKRNDVSTRHRFIDGIRTYRVLAVRESADRRFLDIDAEQRED
ncbi:MAG: phage head closure protein [Pseudolabrys sp.]|nr:phage head closure protein [Pseudolabrys sp.]